MKLIIGNKNYSSWSLRAWMLLAKSELQFEEILEGKFSIADCFYAPVVMRFKTYGIALSELATRY